MIHLTQRIQKELPKNCDDPEFRLSEVVRLDQLTPQCDFLPFLTFSQNTLTFSSYLQPSRWISIKVLFDPPSILSAWYFLGAIYNGKHQSSLHDPAVLNVVSVNYIWPFPLKRNIVMLNKGRFWIPLDYLNTKCLSSFRLLPCQMARHTHYSSSSNT